MSRVHFALLGASATAVVMLAAAAGADGPRTIQDDQYGRPSIWSGAYIGVHLGGTWGDHRVNVDDEIQKAISLDPKSMIGGFQVGYNVQAGRLVLGIEADVSLVTVEIIHRRVDGSSRVDLAHRVR